MISLISLRCLLLFVKNYIFITVSISLGLGISSAVLREIDLPLWEGLRFRFVQEQCAEAYRCWKQRPHEFQMFVHPPAIHSSPFSSAPIRLFPVLDLYERAQQFWQMVLPLHRGQTLLIVSHGGTNHALISTALGLSAAQHHTLQQSNCGVSVLEFPTGKLDQVILQALNLTHYLGETLPKLKEGKQGIRLLPATAMNNAEQIQTIVERLRTASVDFYLRWPKPLQLQLESPCS